MPFQLSPGVNVTEIDLTTVIPAVATTDAAIGGVFKWGPVDKPSLVVSEQELANVYGKPDADNAETWFSAANFLAYSNRLHVSRAHHSEVNEIGDNIRQEVYAIQDADYLIVDGNTAVLIDDGDIILGTSGGFSADQSVLVDGTSLSFNAGDLPTIANVTSNTFEDLSTALTIYEGEKVNISSSTDDLPTGFDDATDYYLVNVNEARTSFQLSAERGGSPISLSDQGTGDLTLVRSADTRITLVGGSYSGSTGTVVIETADPDFSFNAVANNAALTSASLMSKHIVKNEDHYDLGLESNFDNSVLYIAKYPGELGNSLKISVCDSANAFNSTVAVGADVTLSFIIGSNTVNVAGLTNTAVSDVTDELRVGDQIKVGNSQVGVQYLEITAIDAVGTANNTDIHLSTPLATSENITLNSATDIDRYWQYWDVVEGAPGQSNYVGEQGNTSANDELHIVIADEDGMISGVPGQILEIWSGLSRATDALDIDGGNLYYKDVLNQSSNWVWWANGRTNAPDATALLIASATDSAPTTMSFRQGRDIGAEGTCNIGDILRAYDKFKSAEDYDISLIICGKSRGVNNVTVPNYIIDNICERRKDCVAFISPHKSDVVANVTDITEDVVDFRNKLRSTSYAVLDSGYKYMYDKYNDLYRWVPLNGDIAGLAAYTDDLRDPWWSPAGFNRGNLKNVVKLAWNPKKAERDILYKNGVNPIVNFPGQGIVMFGDKTLLAKPSAFDRINVRRLFIVLEKAIATAAKFTLFEFNDEFTRASFVNLVTPFLRDVQGRRGIYDFHVVCDETNNTGEVIDRNEFVGDIYIKPARSINFIQLNFVAVRTGVEFSEVIGQF